MHLRSEMARVIFNIVLTDAVRCMEMCLKYNRAQAPPSSSDKAAFKELITWTWNTTRDPDTLASYEDILSFSFWLSYRCGKSYYQRKFLRVGVVQAIILIESSPVHLMFK